MNPKNPYEGRWNWWYPAIADWMIDHPGGKLSDCARDLGKSVNTISLIKNTDAFTDFYAQRRARWEKEHDSGLRQKTMQVAAASLDILSEHLTQKRTSVPIGKVAEVAFSALDRLGYSPQKSSETQVNVFQQNNAAPVVPVSMAALEEARTAIRDAEKRRSIEALPPVITTTIETLPLLEKDPLDDLLPQPVERAREPDDISSPSDEFPRAIGSNN